MSTPTLLLISPRGQSSARAVFSEEMRELADSPTDPTTIASWTITGPGSPTIAGIVRNSHFEFEFSFSTPLSGTFTLTAASTLESAAGEPLGVPSAQTFTPTSHDLVVNVLWESPNLVFEFTKFGSLTLPTLVDTFGINPVRVIPLDPFLQPPLFPSFLIAGNRITLTTDNGLPFGAPYRVEIDREYIRTTTQDVLVAAKATFPMWGQGSVERAELTPVSATTTDIVIGCTEVLSTKLNDAEGFPPYAGIYEITNGSLGTTVEQPSSVRARFPAASVTAGAQTIGIRKVKQTTTGGTSFLSGDNFSGALTEVVTVPSTVVTKGNGAAGEIAFVGGSVSLTPAAREVTLQVALTTSLPSTPQSLLGITLLNTQITVLFNLTAGQVTASIYKGSQLLRTSTPTPSLNLDITISDATAEGGYFAVRMNDVVIGATPAELGSAISSSTPTTDIALLLGDPSVTTAVVTATILNTQSLTRQSYLTTGLLGLESGEPLAFASSSTSITVSAGSTPTNPGFQNTGKAAYGVYAEYVATDGDQIVDAIQVMVALTSLVQIPSFQGSVVLLGQDGSPFDVVAFDETYLNEDKEVSLVFIHPKVCIGVTAGVTITINGVEYSARAPVADTLAAGNVFMVLQPASWWRPRVDPEGIVKMGPAVVFT